MPKSPQLLDRFNQARCLLILDNGESIMQGGENAGAYRDGYEGYGELFRRVGGTSHKSCVVLTSRENPKEIAAAARDNPLVRCLPLTGLTVTAAEELFHDRHLSRHRSPTAIADRVLPGQSPGAQNCLHDDSRLV
jgi:hypothetical protein